LRIREQSRLSRGRRSLFVVCRILLALPPLRGDIIDRIAVSVGNRVITASDLDREIRVTAFLNGVKPDFSPANKRATVERMIEQKLIRRELENSRYPVPGPSEIEPVLDKIKKDRFRDEADLQSALSGYGITEQDVKDELLWQRTLLSFIDVRFRPGIQVSEQEIQNYFNDVVAPAAEASHPRQPVTLEEYRAQIEATLAGKRVDQEVDTWLHNARQRLEIIYHDEVLR